MTFFIAFSISASAQTSLSVFAQPGLTNINGLSYSGFGGRAGLGIEHHFADRWDLSAGLGFYSVGDRVIISETGGGHDLTVHTVGRRLNFIDLEVTLGFWIADRIQVSVGPYVGYLLNSSEKHHFEFTDAGVISETSYTENQTGLFEQLDVGVRPSVSFGLNDALFILATFSQGLRNLSVLDFINVNQKTQAVLLGLEWKLGRF